MNAVRSVVMGLAMGATIAVAGRASAATYDVPTVAWPTLQLAIDDAATNGQATNVIELNTTPIETSDPIVISYLNPAGFHGGRTLVIRPKPGIATLRRVSIVSLRPQDPILQISDEQNITWEDVDLLRNITNFGELVNVARGTDITFDRCRIGLIWPSFGIPGLTMVHLSYPKRVVFRNCITFSVMRDAFAVGIAATAFIDPENSVYLYNNLIADYRDHGLVANGTQAGQVIALRNNVFINDPDYPAVSEPTAVESHVDAAVTVLTSHNSVFTDAFRVEDQVGAQLLLHVTAADFLNLPRADASTSFWTMDWAVGASWDPNPDFYRLVATGPLHSPDSRQGITVKGPPSMPLDYPVTMDIERDLRPGGDQPHTDRGPDQIEPGLPTAGVVAPARSARLVVARRSPGHDPSLVFTAPQAGDLAVEVMDVAGRVVARESRHVGAGESGSVSWTGAEPGMYFYRAQLVAEDGVIASTGRCVVVR